METAASQPGQRTRGSGTSAEDVLEGASDEWRRPESIIEGRYSRSQRALRSLNRIDPAQSLGFLSIGLGVAGILAPSALGRAMGMQRYSALLPLVGIREIAVGAGLLAQRDRPAPWLWSRVAGDAMDLALIGTALRPSNPARGRTMGAFAVVAAITAVDIAASLRETSRQRQMPRAMATARAEPLIEHTIAINRSQQECYAFWRDVTNIPKFSPLIESVTTLDERRSHWVLRGLGGKKVEWDSEITTDVPGERIAWHSLSGALKHAGVVRFERAPGGRGTFVSAMMHYRVPGGRLAAGLAKIVGKDPNHQVREDLRRFKNLIETGEVPSTRGQPSGRRSFLGRMTRDGRQSREGR
jgi:uncharacterized membrane protein